MSTPTATNTHNGQHLQDDGELSRYFAMMLHIDDDDLDPFEYKLLGHYRKICGLFKSKSCTESAETTAIASKMSLAKVREARKSLASKGRISIETSNGRSLCIKINDCMSENIKRYSTDNPYQKREGSQIREISPTKNDRAELSNPIADIRIEETKESNALVAEATPVSKTEVVNPTPLKPVLETPELLPASVAADPDATLPMPPKAVPVPAPKNTLRGDLFVLVHKYAFNNDPNDFMKGRAGKCTGALLKAFPDIKPDEFERFAKGWKQGLDFPSGEASLPKSFGLWRSQGSSSVPRAPREKVPHVIVDPVTGVGKTVWR